MTIELLPQVRKLILQEKVRREEQRLKNIAEGAAYWQCGTTVSVGLSWLVWQVSGVHVIPGSVPLTNQNRYTSGGPKKSRGHVQACLSLLAKEGIMFGRNHPEHAVQRYEHGERDKYFRIRISYTEAKHRLAKMK